jgi:hypothetical protein
LVFAFEIKGLLITQIEKELLVARNYFMGLTALDQDLAQCIPDDH